jgi:chemotaxis receptor (MCP) glutamine deamidase CheD
VPSTAAPTLERVHIQSGEIYTANRPVVVMTLLGSCVAACLYDPERGVGGMNHFMLPSGSAREGWSAVCFGTNAMELLINELLGLGARREQLRAHAFGGASVLGPELQAHVGDENARFIRGFLEREGIPLESARLGGDRPLHVSFEPHTGRVRLRAVGEAMPEVAHKEAQVLSSLNRQTRALDDGVTLF